MAVALLLSSQKPGLSESCFSSLILYRRFATSKKPPQDGNPIPHNPDLFLCHSREDKRKLGVLNTVPEPPSTPARRAALKDNFIPAVLFTNFKAVPKISFMKSFFPLLLAVIAVFASCKKTDTAGDSKPIDKIQLDNAVVVSKGILVFTAGSNETGLAKIYLQQNGRYVVALEDLEYKTIFDMGVYLSSIPVYASGSSLKLYSAKNFDNNIYYLLQTGVDAKAFKYIVIQKPAAAEPVATAALR